MARSRQFSLSVFGLLFTSLVGLACAACKGEQSYVLSMKFQFTRATLPILPSRARLPVLVAVAHSDSFDFFKRGEPINDAVAEVVSRYRPRLLEERLERIVNDDNDNSVASYAIADDPDVDGTVRVELRVRDDASRISVMVPMSPSPAWFLGVDSYDVCADDGFVQMEKNIEVQNLDAGLAEGTFESFDPREEGKKLPVGPATALKDEDFATLSLEKGTLGVDWWKILLGVLVAVAVLVVLVFFLYPRIRRKRVTQIPLTAQDGVEW